MGTVTISRKEYRNARDANHKINHNFRHIPAYQRPKWEAFIGKTSVQFMYIEPGSYDPRGRPSVPVRNIRNTRQKTLSINPGYKPEERVKLEWI